MTESKPGPAELQAKALNDVENCVRALFVSPDPDRAWYEIISSLHTAIGLGVTMQSALSRLLNSLPDSNKDVFLSQFAEMNNLSKGDLEGLMAPED